MRMNKTLLSIVASTTLTLLIFAFPLLYPSFRHNPFLDDFDFLVYHLHESFPFFGVAERRLGIDLDELLTETREGVANAWIEVSFLARLGELNRKLGYMAHFQVIPADASAFGFLHNHYVGHGLNPPSAVAHFRTAERTLRTEIIEDGKIARVTFSSFGSVTLSYADRNLLSNFLKMVHDYEHLIVDIRQVRGGWFSDQVEFLIRPNITERIEFYSFGFFTNGQLAELATLNQRQTQLMRGNIGHHFSVGGPRGYGIYPASELVEKYGLVYMNEEDLESLRYGYKLRTIVAPWHDSPYSFNGQIWVLTSRFNFSGAEAFARLAKEAGFTLVGQTTGGAIGSGSTTHFRLPYTGTLIRLDTLYITDSKGRAKEEFPTQPHHFVEYRMCALETTLAFIEYGTSR